MLAWFLGGVGVIGNILGLHPGAARSFLVPSTIFFVLLQQQKWCFVVFEEVPYGYIYEIVNTVNGKTYIGQRKLSCDRRWREYMGSGVLIKAAIRKYGKDKFVKRFICYGWSHEDLNILEQSHITQAMDDGRAQYNLFTGLGAGGDTFSLLSPQERKDAIRKMTTTLNREDVRRKIRTSYSDTISKKYQHVFDDKGDEILEMYSRFISIKEISKTFSIPRKRVRDYIESRGVKIVHMNKKGESPKEILSKRRETWSSKGCQVSRFDSDGKRISPRVDKKCEVCGASFTSSPNKKFCSKKCRNIGSPRDKFDIDEDLLKSYLAEGLDSKDICQIIGCKWRTLANILRRHNLSPKKIRPEDAKPFWVY